MKKLRVRFAPSPTGALHLGGLRTALYNYLLAKKNGGDFILRIEDTDQNRFVLGAEKYLLEALNWCGLIPDESPYHRGEYGPYRQSERKSIYAIYFQYLIEKGHAYYAFDTEEILDEKRKKCQKQGAIFAYNAKTRLQMQNSLSLTAQQIKNRIDKGDPYVVRFKTPINNEVLTIQDQIRGEIKINTDNIDDKVLVKSNGVPTYHLANVVDDHLMMITHVIRGEEWLSSLPLHLLLYRAMEWEAPYFAHLPLILKPQGKGKLSKRDINMGFPIFPIKWIDPQTGTINYGYREEGYFPEAFINMLALLGWNPGDEREILSLKELIDLFSLNQVSKSNAHFSKEKAEWFNQQYLQRKSLKELTKLFEKELKKHQINSKQEYSEKVIKAVKERAHFIHDIWEMSSYFFIAPVEYKYKAFKRIWKKESLYIVKHLINHLSNQQDWSFHRLKKDLEDFVRIQKINFTNLIQLLRLALVGDLKGVDIFFIMEMLGLEETIARINRFIEKASKQKNLI